MADDRKPFTFTIRSRDRAAGGSVSKYTICQLREAQGDWEVRVRAGGFACAPNKVTELQLRGAGLSQASSDYSNSWLSALTALPGVQAGEGTFFVSNGVRGSLDVRWVDTSTSATQVDETAFPEHVLHFVLTPI